MKHSRKVIKVIKKLHNKITETHTDYFDELKLFLTRVGYDMTLFEIHPNKMWHIVIFHKESKTLFAVLKVGYKGYNSFHTNSIKMYQEETE